MSDSYNPMDCSLPGSSIHEIPQARILKWIAISSSKELNLGLLHCSGILSAEPPGKPHQNSEVSASHSIVPNSLRPHGLQPTRLLCPWDFPGKDTGVCCHFLLQGIFPTQRWNPGLLHCRQILYWLSWSKFTCNAKRRLSWNCLPFHHEILRL